MRNSLYLLYFLCTFASAALRAPEPVVEGSSLVWESIDAITINVHSGNGEYLESIPGDATRWTSEHPGDYFLVSADHGDWRHWARSPTLRVLAPSTAVNHLRGLVYGPFSLEIFWSPPSGATSTRYAIYRDDTLLEVCDCVSFYEDNVRPDTDYRYTVIPMNEAGVQAEPATVSLRTRSLNEFDFSPVNLTATVYSSTTAELFWNRPDDPDSLLSHYVIYRGDEPVWSNRVGETTGISFYDDGLEPCTDYTYHLELWDIYNREALPRPRVEIMTAGCAQADNDDGEDSSASPTIGKASYENLLAHVFEIFTGNQYNEPLLVLADAELLDAEVLDWWTDETPIMHTLFACEEGSAELDQALGHGFMGGGQFVDLSYRFDDCLDNGVIRRGNVEAFDGGRYGPTVSSDGLSVYTDTGLATEFSGTVELLLELAHRGKVVAWGTEDVQLLTHTVDGELAVENMTSFFVAEDWIDYPIVTASLEGGFTVRSDKTGGEAITVTVTLPFSYSWNTDEPPESSGGQLPDEEGGATIDRFDQWYFESGQLELRAEDGSFLLLDADTGVADTVLISLDNAEEQVQFETSWSPWQPVLHIDD